MSCFSFNFENNSILVSKRSFLYKDKTKWSVSYQMQHFSEIYCEEKFQGNRNEEFFTFVFYILGKDLMESKGRECLLTK